LRFRSSVPAVLNAKSREVKTGEPDETCIGNRVEFCAGLVIIAHRVKPRGPFPANNHLQQREFRCASLLKADNAEVRGGNTVFRDLVLPEQVVIADYP